MAARASLASLLLLFCIIAHRTSGHKILVYNSKFGHSHSNFLGRIADILAEAGHNVTSLVPIMDASLADGTEKSHVIHVQPDPQIAQFYKNPAAVSRFEMSMFNPIVPFLIGRRLATTFARTCQRVLEEPGLIERLRAEHYDVYITENFDVCGIGFPRSSCPWTQCHSVQGPIGSLSIVLSLTTVPLLITYPPSVFYSHVNVIQFRSELAARTCVLRGAIAQLQSQLDYSIQSQRTDT